MAPGRFTPDRLQPKKGGPKRPEFDSGRFTPKDIIKIRT
jgi:hypothetical protein